MLRANLPNHNYQILVRPVVYFNVQVVLLVERNYSLDLVDRHLWSPYMLLGPLLGFYTAFVGGGWLLAEQFFMKFTHILNGYY